MLSWLSLTLVPVACLAGIGVLVLLGQQAGLAWAEDFRQSFRHTLLWRLAFWEWIGFGSGFVFMALSVLLLPASCGERTSRAVRASLPAEAGEDSLLREQWRA